MAFRVLLNKIQNRIETQHIYKLHTTKKVPSINKHSPIGTKLKYYRRLNDINQTDLANMFNVSRDSIMALENKNKTYYNQELVNKVTDILDVRNTLTKSNSYLGFIINNPSKQIKEFRIKNDMTKMELARKLKVSYVTIKRWEYGLSLMTNKNYKKYKAIKKGLKLIS